MDSKRCTVCTRPSAQPCGCCKAAYYCDKACQKRDWKSHKLLCKAFTEQQPRPSPSHYRAIFFDAEGTKPQLVWITHGEYSTPKIHGPAAAAWINLEELSSQMEKAWVGCNHRTGLPLPDMRVCCFEDFNYHKAPMNMSMIHAIKHYTDDPNMLFRGPVLVYIAGQRRWSSWMYEDVTLEHLRHIIDYSVWCGNEEFPPSGPNNQGVESMFSIREILGEEYHL